MIYRIIVVATLCLMLAGCSRQHDERLQQLASQVEDAPAAVIEALDSLDSSTLSEADRHYHDLLLIKARDKAYVTHTSDSLILDVINYYADHQQDDLYAEALYYGGRVYSDMGDYPASLQYFQSALDLLPADTPNLKLRGNVLSQTGRLLDNLRLFEQASPYIEEVIKLDSICNDTINYVYDLQLLSELNYRAKNYSIAERLIKKALRFGNCIPQSIDAKSRMHLSGIKLREGKIDSALIIIRNIPNEVKPITRTGALVYAAQIYQAAGISDTAYMYAKEILNDPDITHHGIAYQVLLSSDVRNLMAQDTIDNLISDYRRYLEDAFDQNESQQALIQQSYYNYQQHERKRLIAESDKNALLKWVIIISIVIMLMTVALLLLRIRYKNKVIQLHRALENVNQLTEQLNVKVQEAVNVVNNNDITGLRLQLRQKLINLSRNKNQADTVDATILGSEAYLTIREYVRVGRNIKDNDELWSNLEKVVLHCSPEFKINLKLLTDGKLSQVDYRTALLIRCGITPSEMVILLGRSKGTISSRRESLCYKVFDENRGTKTIDSIIRLL